MNTDQFNIGRFTFTRDPDGEVLLDIAMSPMGDSKMMTAEQAMELAQFLAGGLDIYQAFMAEEMREANMKGGMAEAQATSDYHIAIANACTSLVLCEQCQARIQVDFKRQARKVRELNTLLFEEIKANLEKRRYVHAQVARSTTKILEALKGIEQLCDECQAHLQGRIKEEFFRIRQNERYRESSKEAKNE